MVRLFSSEHKCISASVHSNVSLSDASLGSIHTYFVRSMIDLVENWVLINSFLFVTDVYCQKCDHSTSYTVIDDTKKVAASSWYKFEIIIHKWFDQIYINPGYQYIKVIDCRIQVWLDKMSMNQTLFSNSPLWFMIYQYVISVYISVCCPLHLLTCHT